MPLRSNADRLALLFEATTLRSGSYDERIHGALQVVTDALGMQIGILSRIEGDVYTVVEAYAPGLALGAGDAFELGATYCSITLAEGGIKSIDEMGASEHRGHPCYDAFQLESYIGASVTVDGEPYGTVNFSSTEPRDAPFTEADEDLLRILARWVGLKLAGWQTEARLRESERNLRASEARFRLLTEAAFEAIAVSREARITDVNDAFCELFGYDAFEAIGRPATDFVIRSDVERVAGKIRSGSPDAYEVTARRRDGTTFIAEVRGKTVDLPDGPVRVTAVRDVTARKRTEARLQHEALHDPLTGLKNRAAFTDALQQAGARAARYADYGFAVLFVDLDRFKSVNDRLGHHAGDQLLRGIARRITGCLRELDVAARLGGDEFVVLLDGVTGTEVAAMVAQRLLDKLSEPYLLADQPAYVTCSIGVSLHTSSVENPEYLIRNADAAMYRAKQLGKARVVAFEDSMRHEANERAGIEANLARAVRGGEFELHYQPIIDLGDRSPVAFEALLRWPQPDGGFVGPDKFIPIAEETGVIVPLGYWVIEEACRQLRAWEDASGRRGLRMHVNLSARQFVQPDLASKVAGILERAGVRPECLALEVTETAVMADPQQTAAIMRQLKALGVRLHIDDFGTGYSSLAYLQKFPIDALKVDRSFVREMVRSDGSLRIVQTVLSLAKNLQLEAIAEGIEEEEHASLLKLLDCAYGQGYLYARPAPAHRVMELLAV